MRFHYWWICWLLLSHKKTSKCSHLRSWNQWFLFGKKSINRVHLQSSQVSKNQTEDCWSCFKQPKHRRLLITLLPPPSACIVLLCTLERFSNCEGVVGELWGKDGIGARMCSENNRKSVIGVWPADLVHSPIRFAVGAAAVAVTHCSWRQLRCFEIGSAAVCVNNRTPSQSHNSRLDMIHTFLDSAFLAFAEDSMIPDVCR